MKIKIQLRYNYDTMLQKVYAPWALPLIERDTVPTFEEVRLASGLKSPLKIPDLLVQESIHRIGAKFLLTDTMVRLVGYGGTIKKQREKVREVIHQNSIDVEMMSRPEFRARSPSDPLLSDEESELFAGNMGNKMVCILLTLKQFKRIVLCANTKVSTLFQDYLIDLEEMVHVLEECIRLHRERQDRLQATSIQHVLNQRVVPAIRPRLGHQCVVFDRGDGTFYLIRGQARYIQTRKRTLRQKHGWPIVWQEMEQPNAYNLYHRITEQLPIDTRRCTITLKEGYSKDQFLADLSRVNRERHSFER